jgi:RNA polymerase sigma-70 factor, ECF subfamily
MPMTAVLAPHSINSTSPKSGDCEVSQSGKFAMWIAPEFEFVERVSRRFSSSKAEGEDLAQDALAKAYRGIGGFDGRYPRAWMHRIIQNTAASRARRRRLTEVSLDATFETDNGGSMGRQVATEDPGPDTVVVSGVLDPILETAMDELAPHYRSVINLVDLGGASYEEAAAALEVPIGTVMSRLHRGRGKLRNELAGSHLDRSKGRSTSTDGSLAAPV